MSSDLVIEARGLSKRFKLYDRPRHRFFEWITFGKRTLHHSFWALRNVDVHLKRGEKLGIIGANGSGKSTLLKILAGSLSPTEGTRVVKGRAFALIELTTGFNRDLTGRENISFVGMMLGLEREYVEARTERIIEFADIGDFIDRPVRFYSSGMFVRLAFSLFAFLEPDLLMIDEAFAVGDAEFKEKSYKLMKSMVRAEGRSVIFVSHSMSTIEGVSDRVMWLEHGVCRMDGEPRRVIEAYREHLKERKQERLEREVAIGQREREGAQLHPGSGANHMDQRTNSGLTAHSPPGPLPERAGESLQSARSATAKPAAARPATALRSIRVPTPAMRLPAEKRSDNGSGAATVDAIWLEAKDGTPVPRVGAHRKFAVGCAVRFAQAGEPVFGIRIIGVDGAAITAGETAQPNVDVVPVEAGEERAILWPIARGLAPGSYNIMCWCALGRNAQSEGAACASARLQVDGPPRVDAALNLVMRPMIGRAVDDR
jgi:ABC-type polysaccharide/polyol phosphate transport system ATPase subunit